MNSRKEKIANMINLNANTTSEKFYNPGYQTNPYFGASTFYGEQSRLFEHNLDAWHKDPSHFLPSSFKAIGRQLMK
jgi:hypothetical protein